MMNQYDEPFISEKQQQDYNLLVKLSENINNELSSNRKKAIAVLMDENSTVLKKKTVLGSFVQSRIDFADQEIAIDGVKYKYKDLIQLASKLYEDNTFYGNDSPYVMNGLAFYENSITFEDVIIAFHNYRLVHEDEALWHLSLLLCRYIYTVLSMETNYREVYFDYSESLKSLEQLAEYIVEFWNKYLKDVEINEYTLVDDKKRDFYDMIDADAAHYFASEDAEDAEEKSMIDAEYAAELVSQCSKSLYLLMSTLKEIDDESLSMTLRKLRKVVMDICDTIYRNEDSYRDLEKDNRINSEALMILERDNQIRLLQLTLKNAIDKLRGCDSETTLNNRIEALQDVSLMESEELTEDFVKEFSKILMQSIPCDLDSYYKRLEVELESKYLLLPEVALNALASAEYLYDLFVKKKAPAGFDYSGIAVLYFQAFETAYDTLLIEPYSRWLSEQKIDDLYEEKRSIKSKKYNKRTQEEKERLDEIEKKILIQYFSKNFDLDMFYYKKSLVTCLELGRFQRFIDLSSCLKAEEGEQAYQLINFLESHCFNKAINAKKIESFAQAVRNATDPRNKAAHGLHGLQEADVKEDKIIVYDETNIKDIKNYKNLLYAFLDFFY